MRVCSSIDRPTCMPLTHSLTHSRTTEPLLEPPSDVKLFRTPQGYRLAVRYSGWDSRNSSTIEDSPLLLNAASTRRRHFPIAIPNGLAATALAISSMHERLVAAGFEVRVDSISCCSSCSSLPLCVECVIDIDRFFLALRIAYCVSPCVLDDDDEPGRVVRSIWSRMERRQRLWRLSERR